MLMRFIVTELLMGKLQIFHHALLLPCGGLLGGFLLLLLLVFLNRPSKPNSPNQQYPPFNMIQISAYTQKQANSKYHNGVIVKQYNKLY